MAEEPQTFGESIFGKGFYEEGLVKAFLQLPLTLRVAGGLAVLAALLYVPYLGAVGLWDPWETHYGEVAREMVHRGDWVYPYWENAWFFSKPAGTMWLMALGMSIVGTDHPVAQGAITGGATVIVVLLYLALVAGSAYVLWKLRRAQQKTALMSAGAVFGLILLYAGFRIVRRLILHHGVGGGGAWQRPGAVALYTEWGMRLPFVALSITAVALLGLAVSRVVSRRAGLATGFVLMTMPMYFLLSRQTVTDTPFVTSLVAAMACAIIGQLDPSTKHRAAWWYAFYVFAGYSTLSKGLLGIGLPAVMLLIYAAFSVIQWNGEAWRKHFDWVAKHALFPLAAGGGALVASALVSYLLMKNGYAGTGDVRDQLTARKVFAGIIGFVVGVGVFVAVLERRGPKQGEMPSLWAQFYKMRLGTGIVVFFLVALPWYLTLSLFEGVDDESKGYWYRFFIHDHFNRLAEGVHTTTPGGDFTYFITQGGYAIFPWVALVPGAFAWVARIRLRGGTRVDHVGVLAAIWVALTFALFGMSETKFHHYVFPVLPGLAILIGLYIDKLWDEGVAKHAVPLLFGLVLLMLVSKDLASNPKDFTDLFVYNYDRPYPFELVTKPLSLFELRPLWWGDLIALVLLAFGGYLTYDAFMDKSRPVFTRTVGLAMVLSGLSLVLSLFLRGRASPSMLLGLAILFASLYLGYEASKEKDGSLSSTWVGTALFAAVGGVLLVQGVRVAPNVDPLIARLVDPVNLKNVMGFGFGVAILLLAVAAMLRARAMMFSTFAVFAFAFALWFNWGHWVDLSHHWTQRDLFWKYYEMRKPDEPITAFLMNWRGETFYSRNQVKQIKDNGRMSQYANQPGRKWALVEHNRLGILKSAAGPNHTVTVYTTPEFNNKFVLVSID